MFFSADSRCQGEKKPQNRQGSSDLLCLTSQMANIFGRWGNIPFNAKPALEATYPMGELKEDWERFQRNHLYGQRSEQTKV